MKSQSKWILAFVVLACFGLFIIFRSNKISVAKVDATKNQKLYEVISAPLPKTIKTDFSKLQKKTETAHQVPAPSPPPKWCQAQWDQLISLGTFQFKKNLEQTQNQDFFKCIDFLAMPGVKTFI